MNMRVLLAIIMLSVTTNCVGFNSAESLQHELGIYLQNSPITTNKSCIYLVHHGSTEWSEQLRLQGWNDIPLSKQGNKEVNELAVCLNGFIFSKIYSSPLQSARETSKILSEQLKCEIIQMPDLRGEYHGDFEGLACEQYSQEPHFKDYDSLAPHEEIFSPCGKNGESKAEVVRRVIPCIKKIAAEHIGENIIVVTHGGVFKVLNFFLGNYSAENGTVAIPNGDVMVVYANEEGVFLKKVN